MIIQSQIKKVIYFSDKYADKPTTIASKKLLDAAGVEYVKFTSATLNGHIDLNFVDVHHIGKLDLNEKKVSNEHLCWTDYFMSIAVLASYRSRVASNQMGACIINSENRIVGKTKFPFEIPTIPARNSNLLLLFLQVLATTAYQLAAIMKISAIRLPAIETCTFVMLN